MSKAVLTAPLERSKCLYQRSLLSFRIRSRSSMPSRARSPMDLVVTMSCSLTLQICVNIALSFCCLLGSKRKLPPQACQVRLGLPAVVCRPRSVHSLAPCTSVIRVLCQVLESTAFLTQCLQPLQNMLLLPTPVRQTAHGNSPELCRRPRPMSQIMIFVFPAFTLSPFSSNTSFQVKSHLTHSSSNSAMITRSYAQRSSQGIPEQNSHDKASSTMMKSRVLNTKPW